MSKAASAALFFLCSLATASVQADAGSYRAQSGPHKGALLELYTSEGCSSCPPADQWMAGLAATAEPSQLSLLGFHVDYWDDSKWQDRFANQAYTERQNERAHARGSSNVYTPQVMLGSRLDQRWNQPDDVAATIRAEQLLPSKVALTVVATREAPKLRVDLKATPAGAIPTSAKLYLAMYQNGLSSTVRGGENKGATLHHEHVVRGLWGPWPVAADGATRSLSITPPQGADLAQLGVTAFVQDAATGEILQALSLPLTACAVP